jgi:spermidine synthase
LHLKPRKVLQIGLSSASWAKVITNHKEVESLDIVEINPRYSEIIQEYPEQKLVLSDPKIHIYFDDGRRWLKRHPDKKYDFILMNTTFHWRDQANNLLSKDFLELCKEHLNQGGAIYYNTTYSIDVPYTAAHVFNYISRYSNFIAASDQPFPDDPEIKINNLLKFKYHGKPITEYNDPQLRRVLDRMASADTKNKRDEILKMAEFSNLITDDNLASEFKTSRKPYCPSRNWLQLLKGYIRDL